MLKGTVQLYQLIMDGITETKKEVIQQLDTAAASIAKLAEEPSEFDENPSWLLDDIRELKQLERLKQIRAVPPQQGIFRPRSSRKAVACDYEQLPDVLVNSKAEAFRGRTTRNHSADVKNNISSGSGDVPIRRDESVQKSLDLLAVREQARKSRQTLTLRAMSSAGGLPRPSTRYLERRHELAMSPPRGSAGFRSAESVPRPHTAPNRGRPGSPRKEAFVVSKDCESQGLGRTHRLSPSPEKYRSAEEEHRQRSRVLQTAVVGWWYAKNLKINFDLERVAVARRDAAARVLQVALRKHAKSTRIKNAANVVPACLRRAIIRYRQRRYIGVVKSYLIECAKNQKSKFIRQFLYRVRRLQRLIKAWLATQSARCDMLKRYWERVEFNYRRKLADEYRAAQDLLIENERRLKKRARAPIAELWSKTNTKVCALLKKVDKVQLRAAREKAFEDNTEMPTNTNVINQITLGEFEGKISDDIKLKIINETVRAKRNIFLDRKKSEKMAATQALSSK